MLVSEFIDELARRLRDTSKRQWNEAFLVDAANSAFTSMCNAIPSSHTIELDLVLRAGTRQELPEQIHRIVDLLYNITPDGQPSTPVTNVDRGAMDTAAPTWRSDAARSTVRHWIPSDIEESTFDVWPQATEGMSVHGVFTKVPVINPDADAEDPVIPEVIVPPVPVPPTEALYTVSGSGSAPSDGRVQLQFIDSDPVVVPDGGWPVPDETVLDVVLPAEILAGNILSDAVLIFNRVVDSYDEDYELKDNDDYTRIYNNDPMTETGNYILDTNVAPQTREFESEDYTVSIFPVLDGTFDGARFDAISSGPNYAWLTGNFVSNVTGQVTTTAFVTQRSVGFHGYWDVDNAAWVIVDGSERVVQ